MFLTVDPIISITHQAYDYAGQDPINAYDLDGKCLGIPGSGACPWDSVIHAIGAVAHGVAVAAIWVWHLKVPGGSEPEDVEVSQHALDEADLEGWDISDMRTTMREAPARYRGFKYMGKYGRQLGVWNPKNGMFLGIARDKETDKLIIATAIKAERRYIARLIRSGWR